MKWFFHFDASQTICMCFATGIFVLNIIEEPNALAYTTGMRGKLDLVFVMDGSADVPSTMFEAQKDFVRGTVDAYDFEAGRTRVGILSYGFKPSTVLNVRDGLSQSAVNGRMRNVMPVGGARNVSNALEFAGSQAFDEAAGNSKAKLLVLLVSGRDNTPLDEGIKLALNKLNKRGIEVMVIVLGKAVDMEMVDGVVKKDMVEQVERIDRMNTKLTDVIEASEKLTGKPIY